MLPKSVRGASTVIGPGKRQPVPITLDAVVYDGGFVNGTDGITYIARNGQWRPVALADEAVSLAKTNITVTVGSGGDFPTIGRAVDYMNAFVPSQAADQLQGTIRILSGYVAAEQIILRQANLGWVQIIADDATVVVTESALTELSTTGGVYPFMEFVGNCPVIGCYFESDQSRTGSQYTIGAIVRAGFFATTPYQFGDDVTTAPRCGFGRFSTNLTIRSGANCRLSVTAKFINARDINVELLQGTGVSTSGEFYGAGAAGLFARETSGFTLTSESGGFPGSIRADWRRLLTEESNQDLRADRGSIVIIRNDPLGGISQAPWTWTKDAFIADNRVTAPIVSQGIIRPESYTVATQPSAAAYPAHLIHVSNGNSGAPCLAVSNGTDWLRIVLGAATSTT